MNETGRETVLEAIQRRIREREESGRTFTIGIAVGGGLLNGSFVGGVLEALDDLELTPHVKCIVASSAGSMPASFYATGVNIGELKHSFIEPGHEIKTLGFADIFHPNLPEIRAHLLKLITRPPVREVYNETILPVFKKPFDSIVQFIRTGKFSWDLYASILSWLPFFNPTNLLFKTMPITGIFSGDRLKKYLDDNLKIKSFEELNRKVEECMPGGYDYHNLFITGCLLDQPGSRIVFGRNGCPNSIPEAAAASMAFPGFFKPFYIDSIKDYVIDGEVASTLSMDIALDEQIDLAIGSNIYVPYKLNPRFGSLNYMGLGYILQQTLLIIIGKKIERGLEYYSLYYPNADLVLVQPDENEPDLFFRGYFNYRGLLKTWDVGYRRTMDTMKSPVIPLQERGRFRTLINKIGFWNEQIRDHPSAVSY